ncbi:MAG TPA: hypothetical protein DDW52_26915 [Planctomycetaceae bacterium]|nr:hypothetical protein [Planctomycetaceae bacterium]
MQSLSKTWRNNNGSLLLTVALAAAGLMSAISYFQLLPEIEFTDDEAFAAQALQSAAPKMQVDVIIATPRLPAGSQPITGMVFAYPAFGELNADKAPLISKRFVISESGIALTDCKLPTVSQYAIVAIFDLNDNQQLDFEDRDEDDTNTPAQPIEPLRLSSMPTKPPTSLSLADSAVAVGNSRSLIHFVFTSAEVAEAQKRARQDD